MPSGMVLDGGKQEQLFWLHAGRGPTTPCRTPQRGERRRMLSCFHSCTLIATHACHNWSSDTRFAAVTPDYFACGNGHSFLSSCREGAIGMAGILELHPGFLPKGPESLSLSLAAYLILPLSSPCLFSDGVKAQLLQL